MYFYKTLLMPIFCWIFTGLWYGLGNIHGGGLVWLIMSTVFTIWAVIGIMRIRKKYQIPKESVKDG